MNKILSFLMILLLVLLCACKSNAVKPAASTSLNAKEYTVSNFNSIEVSNAIDVKFSQSKVTKVVVDANDEAFQYLKVEVAANKLSLYFDTPKNFRGHLSASVSMSAPSLQSIVAYNSADIEVVTPLKGDKLKIEAYNSADVEFKHELEYKSIKIGAFNSAEVDIRALEADMVDAQCFNSADIELGGSTKTVALEAYNTGDIDAEKLQAKDGKVTAFNAGAVKCNVVELKSSKYNSGKIKNINQQ